MKTFLRIFALVAVLIVSGASGELQAGKTKRIKLTGTAHESILMTVGKTGRTEVISDFPYYFEIPSDEMPVNLKFQSENYLYYDIEVPQKPYDTTGHVYLVKINETAMSMQQNRNISASSSATIMGQSNVTEPISGIDVTHGVNAAPVTGHKSEKTFAIIIANEEYEMAANVDNAVSDGLAFKEYCIKTLGIPGNNVKYASNLSYGKMRKSVNDILDLADMYNGEANLIFYYAGHGIPDNNTKDAFLMPVDADGTDTQICFSLQSLYNRINSTSLNQCVVFLDACFSGAQRDGDMIVAARGVKLKPKEAAPEGKTIVFSATSGDQAAFSHKEEKHGLFTYHLLSKLKESKGKVSLGDLAEYLSEKVGIDSRRLNNSPQTPTVIVASGIQSNWKNLKLIQ